MASGERDEYDRFFFQSPDKLALSEREITYRDDKPVQIVVQIPLKEYFERIKRHRADAWQTDLCDRLQEAAVNRTLKQWFGVIHAEGQLGKPVSVDSLILMSDGSYKRLGDVKTGDYVISHRGLPRKVLKVFKQGMLDCVRIETHCERATVAALDHPFMTP